MWRCISSRGEYLYGLECFQSSLHLAVSINVTPAAIVVAADGEWCKGVVALFPCDVLGSTPVTFDPIALAVILWIQGEDVVGPLHCFAQRRLLVHKIRLCCKQVGGATVVTYWGAVVTLLLQCRAFFNDTTLCQDGEHSFHLVLERNARGSIFFYYSFFGRGIEDLGSSASIGIIVPRPDNGLFAGLQKSVVEAELVDQSSTRRKGIVIARTGQTERCLDSPGEAHGTMELLPK